MCKKRKGRRLVVIGVRKPAGMAAGLGKRKM